MGREGIVPRRSILYKILILFLLSHASQTYTSKMGGIDPRRSLGVVEAYPKVRGWKFFLSVSLTVHLKFQIQVNFFFWLNDDEPL